MQGLPNEPSWSPETVRAADLTNAPTASSQRLVLGAERPLAVHVDRSQRRVTLHGELDVATAPLLADAIRLLVDVNPGDITIDICGVGFIDAAGIGCLVAQSRSLAAIGAKSTIVGATARVRQIFDIVQLRDLLEA